MRLTSGNIKSKYFGLVVEIVKFGRIRNLILCQSIEFQAHILHDKVRRSEISLFLLLRFIALLCRFIALLLRFIELLFRYIK